MIRNASTKSTMSKAYKKGRPELIPWDIEMPFLIESRKNGYTYTELADYLSDRYDKAITSQTVRIHIAPNLSKSAEKANMQARTDERETYDSEDSLRLATYLIAHPSITRKDLADALNIPLYRVENLMPLARQHFNGYLVPPVKIGKEQFSDAEMLKGLHAFVKHSGISKREPISQNQYGDWRANLTEDKKFGFPSPVAYRRRFGTWTNACELAGLQANALPKTYTGLSVEDIIVWMATWLRSLREAERGLVDASQGEYRQWLRKNSDAPSEDLIRLRGTWAQLLATASILEVTNKKLPAPKAVSTEGRVKKSLGRRKALKN